ncbi:aminopeptidase [Fructilactobacillus fructivorans]|uniref:Aminopeptidase S (Leu, Val, Phe, Tyr preference) n=1 Tax=Fructilactobacillus fructivorans TaxID=1614 RepID=A0A0C1PR59_9LACO|nr:aminopeptidase [Fructilactobacillus fructivorans]KID42366.1 Aminopeptidase S (Leu, Val, Phe, Tyr preference) [Fructilactobacillus fructivorans]MCT0151017.1 aminopeptidase [Fructilactobacillus fructivorans]MCT2867425.1 aminopeptidase [Fructilactobacillus fructivorans]MCT2869056.1 aminopeptidase [Fructilactobacillus fructivorans]MCT2873224.1 aminopeptidase [Fructilactobacillus fructivorans]
MNKEELNANLKKYAELIVKVGVNVQPGQTVVLYISDRQPEFAHMIVKEAYQAGAADVMVKWDDTFVSQQFLEHASEERLANVPQYLVDESQYIVDKHAARISVLSEDPAAFAKINPKRVATNSAAMGKATNAVRVATQNNDLTWTVVGAADTAWAKQVFPDLSDDEAVDKLWREIFKTARVDNDDPIQAWKEHKDQLESKAAWLNEQQFDTLQYHSPRTDMEVGLPKNHVWVGAGSTSADGISFMPNMPTEEVFTAPDKRRINGHVTSTKPLSYAGTLIEGMEFTFKDGQVVKATAKKGQKTLDHLLQTDPGVRSLGEVSLVPDPSPISQSGIIFYNTLYDENASDHMALGAAYPFSVVGGTEMSPVELDQAGLNSSQEHVDFMMGSDDMNIDGVKADGTVVPVFRDGDWA